MCLVPVMSLRWQFRTNRRQQVMRQPTQSTRQPAHQFMYV